MEKYKNENITFQNLWDATKTVLKAKFIVIKAFLKKKKRRKVSNRHPTLAPKRFRKRIPKAQSRLKEEKSERK